MEYDEKSVRDFCNNLTESIIKAMNEKRICTLHQKHLYNESKIDWLVERVHYGVSFEITVYDK